MLNFLISKAQAAGTLTTADTTAIWNNANDEILANLATNFVKVFAAMVVLGLFFTGLALLRKAFSLREK